MLYFLYGEDDFRSREKLKTIIRRYQKLHPCSLNLRIFDFEEQETKDFLEGLKIKPFFKEKKLFILKHPFVLRAKRQLLKNKDLLLKKEDVFVFFENRKIKKNDPLFLFLKKHGHCQEFKLLKPFQLRIWIRKRVKEKKGKIDAEAEELLIKYGGNNLDLLAHEIDKLIVFKKQKEISKEDVLRVSAFVFDINIFDLLYALIKRNKKKSLFLIHYYFQKGGNPGYLLYMILYQFRSFLLIKTLLKKEKNIFFIHQKTGISLLTIKKIVPLIRDFSFLEIKEIYNRLLEIDEKIKQGKIKPLVAFDIFVGSL